MMASKAAINPTWTLDLASLESWLASAEPGDELVFADGFASPHDAPAWKESIRLVGEGEVRVHHRRISSRRVQHFMVRRTPEIAVTVAALPASAPTADDDDPSNPGARVLTEKGELEFKRLLVSGAGMKINKAIRQVEVAPRKDTTHAV